MIEGDDATEQKEAALSSKDSVDYVRLVLLIEAARAAGHGQVHKAQELATHVEELSQREGLRESQALGMPRQGAVECAVRRQEQPKRLTVMRC